MRNALLLLPLLATIISYFVLLSPTANALAAITSSRNCHHLTHSSPDRRLLIASTTSASILIDVENVRGKTDFALSHNALLDRLTLWTYRRQLVGHVTLVVDHGSEKASGYYLPERGLGVVFAGPDQKADDVIARDSVRYMQQTLERDVVVVTADRELMDRCQQSAATIRGNKRMEIVPPGNLLEDLERVVCEQLLKERGESNDDNDDDDTTTCIMTKIAEDASNESEDDDERKQPNRGENTGDRIILAELLRRQIIEHECGDDDGDSKDMAQYPAWAHARYINGLAG